MNKRQWTGLWITLLAMVMVLSACGGSGKGTENNTASEGSGSEATASSTLTIAAATDIESFDPHNNNNTSSEAVLVNVFDYLIKNDSEQKKVAGLATSWDQVDDTTWRFKLREGVTFHNGDPFTSADVKFTLERVAKDNTLKQNSYFKNIVEVKAVDEHTVDIITDGPDPLLLNRLGVRLALARDARIQSDRQGCPPVPALMGSVRTLVSTAAGADRPDPRVAVRLGEETVDGAGAMRVFGELACRPPRRCRCARSSRGAYRGASCLQPRGSGCERGHVKHS